VGRSAAEALRSYCTQNAITRRLDGKLPPALLARFLQAVLVYYTGNCAEKLAHVDKLPVPALVHFADHLKGGFDKEYRDHLPPRMTGDVTVAFDGAQPIAVRMADGVPAFRLPPRQPKPTAADGVRYLWHATVR
jgi:hypothetical protein